MPAKSKRRQDAASVTIIKREDQVAFASHGGAWKVAYADFITALMAFFLVLWLINATTEDQRKGLVTSSGKLPKNWQISVTVVAYLRVAAGLG